MGSDEISLRSIAKFDGTNFQPWKFQMKTLFDYNELSNIVEGRDVLLPQVAGETSAAREAVRAAWKKKDAKARFYIITACDDVQMEYLTVCETAYEMWVKLSAIHEQRSATNKVSLMEDFHGYAMVPGCGVAQHVARIQNLAFRLRDIGKEVDDDTIIAKITTTLPSKFHAFKSSWANVPEAAQTIPNLLDRLLQEEKHVLREEQTSQALVAVAVNTTERPKKSGKSVYKKGNKSDQFKKNERKKNITCYKCHEKGHYARECPEKSRVTGQASGSSNETDASCAFAFSAMFDKEEIAGDDTWFLDSCASLHSTFHREWIKNYREDTHKNIKVGNDNFCPVKGYGYVEIVKCVDGKYEKSRIENVYYVPSLRKNLLSAGQLTAKGIKVILSEVNKAELTYKGVKVAEGVKLSNNVYRLAFKTIQNYEANTAENEEGLRNLHEKLGHVNVRTIERMVKYKMLPMVDITKIKGFFCEACQIGKLHRTVYKHKVNQRETEPGEMIHSDVVGPMEVESIGRSRWYVNFKDDSTDFRVIGFMQNKSEVFEKFKIFEAAVKNRFGRPIRVLRTDRGGEYVNKKMQEYLSERGIQHEVTAPFTPEQNGKAERDNRTIVECARTILHAKKLPKFLWAEATAYAVYVLNRVCNRKDQSPYEMWTGKLPNLSNLKTFGSDAYIHVPKIFRRKLDPKALKGFFVGFQGESDNVRVYIPTSGVIKESKDVVINDVGSQTPEQPPESQLTVRIQMADDELVQLEQNEDKVVEEGRNEAEPEPNEGEPMLRRSQRIRKSPIRYEAHWASVEEPKSFSEAMNGPERVNWEKAINEELLAHQENGTWKIIEDEGQKTVTSKWVFKIQDQSKGLRYKARLVARGFTQTQGTDYEETFSPVVRYDSLRVLLAQVAQYNLELAQFDVKTAFLYGKLKEDVYMKIPEGVDVGSDRNCVLKLAKSLYGLKQASRCWNETFSEFLEKFSFVKGQADPCVYSGSVENSRVIIALYVDDGLIISASESAVKTTIKTLREFVSLRILDASNFCGIEICRNRKKGTLFISQQRYIERVLSKFRMLECKSVKIPIDKATIENVYKKNELNTLDVPYRELIGSIMFVAVVTRPDIAFATSFVSRFLCNYNKACWEAAKKILKYLKGTTSVGVLYQRGGNKSPVGYSDADYAADRETRRSMSGCVSLLAGGPVVWSSRRQNCVSMSTTESEFIAACEVAKDVIWLRKLLGEIGYACIEPVDLRVDNQSAIRLTKNPEFHNRTKHIDVRYYFLRDAYEQGLINIMYVMGENQVADMLTKPIGRVRHEKLCDLINIREFKSEESIENVNFELQTLAV